MHTDSTESRRRLALLVSLVLAAPAATQKPPKPAVLWRFAAAHSQPILFKGAIYACGKRVYRIDPKTGKELGSYAPKRALRGRWLAPLAAAGDRVFACHSSGLVVCLAPALERVNWTARLPAGKWISHAGALARHRFVVAGGSTVFGLDIDSGHQAWTFPGGSDVNMTPATDGKHVYFGSEAGTFRALDVQRGKLLWDFEGDAEFGWTNPVLADGVVYVGDRGVGEGGRRADTGKRTDEVEGARMGALNAFDAKTGRLLWGRIFGATGLSRPFVGKDTIWIGRGVSVVPMKRKTGELLRDRRVKTGRNPFGTPTVIGDDLVFGNLDGHLYVHDVRTGALRWALRVKGPVQGFTHRGTTVYVATRMGVIAISHALGQRALPPGTIVEFGG